MTRKGDCGNYLEMEFTQAPMGIVFQVRSFSKGFKSVVFDIIIAYRLSHRVEL
jgi:hypothetical protein